MYRYLGLLCIFLTISSCHKNEVGLKTDQAIFHFLGSAGDDVACRIITTKDGGNVLTGSITIHKKDLYIARFSAVGQLLWENHCGTAEDDEGHDIIELADGGFMVSGYSAGYSTDDVRMYLTRFNKNGKLLWQHNYLKNKGQADGESADVIHNNGDGTFTMEGYVDKAGIFYVCTASSGNHFVTVNGEGTLLKDEYKWFDFGQTYAPNPSRPLDDTGKVINSIIQIEAPKTRRFWYGVLNGPLRNYYPLDPKINLSFTDNRFVYGLNAQRTPDSGIVFMLFDVLGSATGQTYIYKIDKDRKLKWQYTYPACMQAMAVAPAGNICLAGHALDDNKMKMIKLSSAGDLIWAKKTRLNVLQDPTLLSMFSGTLCGITVNSAEEWTVAATLLSSSIRSTDIAFFKLDNNGNYLK